MDIQRYCTPSGRDAVLRWIRSLGDVRIQGAVLSRIARLEAGNFGDCKAVGFGVWELRIHLGPGYRVYFARIGQDGLLLLGGGTKGSQVRDIHMAQWRLEDFSTRRNVP
jgi:putative addiction module killer protein